MLNIKDKKIQEIFINYHIPVLINEILGFIPQHFDKDENIIVDACFGEGGYTENFLKKFSNIYILGIEQDPDIYNIAKEKFKNIENVILKNGNFTEIEEFLKEQILISKKIFFAVFDLGISMFHIKESGKGISFNSDVRLDMRLSNNCNESAYDIINTYSKEQLADLFYYYADETMSRQIAKAIVNYRKNRNIETNEELVKIVLSVKKGGKKNPATKVFQALRIKVNNEFENLNIALKKYLSLIERGGRIAVVSYHSGEDRIVKNFIKNNIQYLKILTGKPVIARYEEIKTNPSARSAKLRVFEKI